MKNKSGVEVLRDPKMSKSTAFTKEEKITLGLRGLLPYSISSQEIQKNRVIENLRKKESNIEKYIFLSALQSRNERLYYKTIIDFLPEVLPIIYTPTVGEVCKQFSHIYRIDKGFYITPEDKGDISQLLDNWPEKDVKIIVITDGSRILGLGDLGCNGVGIPIGKLSLYTAGAGVHPEHCLPVMFDMGTDNAELLSDFFYLGYPHKRLKGEAYDELMDEFVNAVQEKYPDALIQFEDFITPVAYKLLEKYREKVLCFNDDIQGTASVALAGILGSEKISGRKLTQEKIMFLGAGSAATGIADLLLSALKIEGLSEEEALENIFLVDIHGLLTIDSPSLMAHNIKYAKKSNALSFIESIHHVKPNILIGASGAGGTFTQSVIEAMCMYNTHPVIFALSNPTSQSECTAVQAYQWSKGKVIFASGSPFESVVYNGKIFIPGQGNNVYIFPGVGLASIAVKAKYLPESVFYVAAKALTDQVQEEDLIKGNIYPSMTKLMSISLNIAVAVSQHLYDLGLAKANKQDNLRDYITSLMYDPTY